MALFTENITVNPTGMAFINRITITGRMESMDMPFTREISIASKSMTPITPESHWITLVITSSTCDLGAAVLSRLIVFS